MMKVRNQPKLRRVLLIGFKITEESYEIVLNYSCENVVLFNINECINCLDLFIFSY